LFIAGVALHLIRPGCPPWSPRPCESGLRSSRTHPPNPHPPSLLMFSACEPPWGAPKKLPASATTPALPSRRSRSYIGAHSAPAGAAPFPRKLTTGLRDKALRSPVVNLLPPREFALHRRRRPPSYKAGVSVLEPAAVRSRPSVLQDAPSQSTPARPPDVFRLRALVGSAPKKLPARRHARPSLPPQPEVTSARTQPPLEPHPSPAN